jgi:hypothetical protein
MTLAELDALLLSKGISPNDYSLTGGLPNEAYCIEGSDGKWKFYYSERGSRTGVKEFGTEDEAAFVVRPDRVRVL